ncbi:hypothetical protein LX87_03203 [Larkinella arboricola]|uniref:Uncharacterized protein n=1 Tax=Larkinella arboricola TaxID=643671 RepID=A0A327WTL5_LARAB|nr:hypothetical protein LX87_03203 [Larkinella arboricola]
MIAIRNGNASGSVVIPSAVLLPQEEPPNPNRARVLRETGMRIVTNPVRDRIQAKDRVRLLNLLIRVAHKPKEKQADGIHATAGMSRLNAK